MLGAQAIYNSKWFSSASMTIRDIDKSSNFYSHYNSMDS